MIYLFFKQLSLSSANALQYGLIKKLLSPLTITSMAHNIKRQLVEQSEVVNINESTAFIIHDCQLNDKRTIYRSYTPGDSHFLKTRIMTTVRQDLVIDFVIRLQTDDELSLLKFINSSRGKYLFNNLMIAKSFCDYGKDGRCIVCTSEDQLDYELKERPVNGYFLVHAKPFLLNKEFYPGHDSLDELLEILVNDQNLKKINGIHYFLPIVAGLRLLGEPIARKKGREQLPHAFAEPLLSLAEGLYLHDYRANDLYRIFWQCHWSENDYLSTTHESLN